MKIRQTRETVTIKFSDSLVVFNLKTYGSFILNDTASLVWNFCRKPKSLKQMVKFFNCHYNYNLNLSKVEKDLISLIGRLKERKLLIVN